MAFLSTSAIPVLRVSAAVQSNLQAVASIAAMMSSKGILLGAIAKDSPSASTSFSSDVRCLWLSSLPIYLFLAWVEVFLGT